MSDPDLIFVTPWYGKYATGGAETICRTVAEHLYKSGFSVQVFTTCSKEFLSDWSNYYKAGSYSENNILVKRFKVDKRNSELFNYLNQKLFISSTFSEDDENNFLKNNINSSTMMDEIHKNKKSLFIFIPYLYGVCLNGCQIHSDRSIMIPCLHDEPYAKMKITRKALSKINAICFNSEPERNLAKSILNSLPENKVIGTGIDILDNYTPDPKKFRKKYNLNDFILYGGRKDEGKNIPLLIDYFCEFLERNNTDLKLVLLGPGQASFPKKFSKNIIDMQVSKKEWYDACAAASIFCLPSVNESFSIVIMESWLNNVPVLVNARCAVTKEHCLKSNGGLFFDNFEEFEGCVKYYLDNPSMREKIGKNGENYVLQNFSWDKIIKKYSEFFNKI